MHRTVVFSISYTFLFQKYSYWQRNSSLPDILLLAKILLLARDTPTDRDAPLGQIYSSWHRYFAWQDILLLTRHTSPGQRYSSWQEILLLTRNTPPCKCYSSWQNSSDHKILILVQASVCAELWSCLFQNLSFFIWFNYWGTFYCKVN